MRILVTGGAGFIGSHLAERLKVEGHQVAIWDNFSSGKEENVTHIEGWGSCHSNPGVYRIDCRDVGYEWTKASWKIDFVYHLAATVGVRRVLEDPAECIDNNVRSLQAVLSLGIPGVFASTSEVYGLTKGALSEESAITFSSKTRWAYAQSKIIGEHLARAAGWKSVRFFNVVGPRQNAAYGAVLPQFVSRALEGEPIPVYGDGRQTRTFLDVRDCCEILDTLRDKEFDVVNVGGNYCAEIGDLAEFIRNAVDSKSEITHVPYEKAYPEGFEECQQRIPDLTKLHSLIGNFEFRSFYSTIQDLATSLKPAECPA